jgi:hypothetical protein
MHQLSRYAARVSYNARPIDNSGVSVAHLSGPIDSTALVDLRSRVIASSLGTKAFLLRFSSALLLFGADALIPDVDDYRAIADGVIICRPDQLEVLQGYARHMAERGVIRCVYLESESERAAAMAFRLAGE